MLIRLIRRARSWLRHRRHDRRTARRRWRSTAMLAEDPARRAVRAPFGNATLAREDARDVWACTLDGRCVAGRRAAPSGRCAGSPPSPLDGDRDRRAGAGATTCVFGLLDALVMRSLPVERPDRLVWFRNPGLLAIRSSRRSSIGCRCSTACSAWNLDRAYVDWSGAGGELVAGRRARRQLGRFLSTLRVTADRSGEHSIRRTGPTPRSRSSVMRHGCGITAAIRSVIGRSGSRRRSSLTPSSG